MEAETLESLAAELEWCDREISERLAGLRSGEITTEPGGAMLGLHDWYRERALIMAAISKKKTEEKVVTFAAGAISSACPRYELIPLNSLIALARRFERGVRIKGEEGAWNALAKHQHSADDPAFVINRLAHGIEHSYKAIARIIGTLPPADEEETADGGDAGAIMFAGALLAQHKARGGK